MLIAPLKNISVPINRIDNPKKRKNKTPDILSLGWVFVLCRIWLNNVLYKTKKTKKERESINESFKSITPLYAQNTCWPCAHYRCTTDSSIESWENSNESFKAKYGKEKSPETRWNSKQQKIFDYHQENVKKYKERTMSNDIKDFLGKNNDNSNKKKIKP